jgi:predicted nuclease of predicted toxin-antitoxin system
LTWFVDRSLGRKIVTDLRAAGFTVEEHGAHFADDAPDAEWLAEAGRRGWIVLTKDKAVRRNALELAAIIAGNVTCFSLGHGNLKAAQMAHAFIAARPHDNRLNSAIESKINDGFRAMNLGDFYQGEKIAWDECKRGKIGLIGEAMIDIMNNDVEIFKKLEEDVKKCREEAAVVDELTRASFGETREKIRSAAVDAAAGAAAAPVAAIPMIGKYQRSFCRRAHSGAAIGRGGSGV